MRTEFPNPQFERKDWINLNGEWDFCIDNEKSGFEKGFLKKENFDTKINVPFCPQSELSGINNKDYMYCVWYKKSINITKEQLNRKVFLNIGACDYETDIWVGEQHICNHLGGYTPIRADITKALQVGNNIITVRAKDDRPYVCLGKQSIAFYSAGCSYTRTTGIWQTVWLEFVPEKHLEKFRVTADTENCGIFISGNGNAAEKLSVCAYYNGKKVGYAETFTGTSDFSVFLKLEEKHLWEVGNGRLYDLEITYGEDKVYSYFGLRNIGFDGYKFIVNGKSVFQRLVLDQGFYPDGIYTAKDESEFIKDIELSLAAGFNGARLHQKVFEPRFLYHCDRMGYIVWGEYPSWGFDHTTTDGIPQFIFEWTEALERDFNHPSIICWCPFNETWNMKNDTRQNNETVKLPYIVTKAADITRPCVDTSGNFHVATDIYDIHTYEQDPEKFQEFISQMEKTGIPYDNHSGRQHYNGQPLNISEYGGMSIKGEGQGWGYGNSANSESEALERYKKLTWAIMDSPYYSGFCYTQLYDVEQEVNGIYTYNRKPKFNIEKVKEINTKIAKIEK